MTMTQEALAPVKWEMGQPLLPQHLLAQEESLLGDASLRFQLKGLPSYGICRLNWDAAVLTQGCLQVTALRLLIQGYNRVVDYPSNAKIVSSPLELEKQHLPHVFCYVFEESASTQLRVDNYLPGSVKKINRRMLKIVLSCQQSLPQDYEVLLKTHVLIYQGSLGIFEQNNQGLWRLSDIVIPPLVQIGASPYLQKPLKQTKTLIRRFRASLTQKYSPQNLPRAHLHDVKLCMNSLQTTLRLIENLEFWDVAQGELQIHPYFVYESLQKLLSDISLFRGEWPEREPLVYQHNQLHVIFKHLFQQLLPRLKLDKTNAQTIELILENGIYSCTLPNDCVEKDSLYLIVTSSGKEQLNSDDLPKVSSKLRLQTLNDYSLRGIELAAVNQPTLGYEFGAHFQCFKLGNGSEREFIHREKSVGFFAQSALKPFDFYLHKKSSRSNDHAPMSN
ncbi:type VI secretion system baseplate subunit TssK [Aliikangiella coralliicola]|uniref:Type VI secretion system baseplate subunit TssK n=1 Tax=Aliikangiella coralliicola TaxID=2592383 RepID=A0A545UG98_9GAMM|nr:type VI secretion system baseplate subunit TssK [Aliikangiella coralliicola]TQV88498.1 hypothetical protein FLL46_08210 [Aliikangiella coralliicola]